MSIYPRGLFLFLIVCIVTILASCGHHRDVRPGTKGVHLVSVQASDKQGGAQDAIRQAQHFCDEREMDAAFIKEENQYQGSMDEGTYNTAKNISKAAQILGGGVVGVGHRRRSSRIGGTTLGAGGVAADQVLGKQYNVKMSFKCI